MDNNYHIGDNGRTAFRLFSLRPLFSSIGARGRVILISVLVLVSVFLPACSPRIIERIVVQRDTTIVHHRDSILHRDSIYVKEWIKGDTVYVNKFHDRYIYRDRWRDSISVREVHDTTTVEKKVEKELTFGQKAKINSFWWLIAAVLGLGVWTFRKPLMKLITKI